jgi:hypothetical protein
VADVCRCHCPFDPPVGPHWWPARDPEPGEHVRAVAIYGADPGFLRRVRVPGGWHSQGSGANHPDCTPPGPWARTGLCWDGVDHPVVDVTPELRWLRLPSVPC